MKTLSIQSDIIHFTGLSKEFPRCELRVIFQREYAEFNQCLGKAFYERLLEDLAQYDCEVYDNEKVYEIGDTVFHEGRIRIATGQSQGNQPANHEYWEDAPRFSDPCLNEVWCLFLGPFLAWSVVRDRLPFITNQLKGTGLVKIFGDKFSAASDKEYHTYQKAVAREVELAFTNLDHFMKNNNSLGCFDDYLGIANTCCGECGCKEEDCTCQGDCVQAKSNTGYGYNFG